MMSSVLGGVAVATLVLTWILLTRPRRINRAVTNSEPDTTYYCPECGETGVVDSAFTLRDHVSDHLTIDRWNVIPDPREDQSIDRIVELTHQIRLRGDLEDAE